jgi:pyrimidine deaminase RibD-like protein
MVTLEPCNHHGHTPPCRQGLIDAGVRRVVIAVIDPTSRGDGGAAELRRAGVDVETGAGQLSSTVPVSAASAAAYRCRAMFLLPWIRARRSAAARRSPGPGPR